MKFWNFPWKILNSEDKGLSLPELVRSIQAARRLTLGLSVMLIVMTSLIYVIAIWPIFLKADLTNPVVQEFLTSDDFKKKSAHFFDELDWYNHRRDGDPLPRLYDFLAGSGPLNGVAVVAHYKLSSRGESGVDVADVPSSGAKNKIGYVPEFTIRLDIRYLSLYVIVTAGLLIFSGHTIAVIFSSRQDEEKAIKRYYMMADVEKENRAKHTDPINDLVGMLFRFHAFAKQITVRRNGRSTITFSDEYDVQYALHALFKLHYLDVRSEEFVPSFAGKNSRMDFFINDRKVGVEVKMVREKLKDKELGDQLIIDIGRYQSHEKCENLICMIYDPKSLLASPHGLIHDLEKRMQGSGMKVRVVVSPLH